jgi:hypothetical protein
MLCQKVSKAYLGVSLGEALAQNLKLQIFVSMKLWIEVLKVTATLLSPLSPCGVNLTPIPIQDLNMTQKYYQASSLLSPYKETFTRSLAWQTLINFT